MIKRSHAIGATLLFGLCIFLSLNWHSHFAKFNYHSEIWADRAGYHVYLPAAFDYHFDAKAFPIGIDERTGNGFHLDSIPGKVITKYPCGVAILRVPFYLIGKLIRSEEDPNGPGFTLVDHAMVGVAASFYGVLGLLLLFLVLKERTTNNIALASVLAILTGTNLLFYLIGNPGMSHVYSFFLFAAFIFAYERLVRIGWSIRRSLILGVLAGLIVVTRPTNILFLPIAFAVSASSSADVLARYKKLFEARFLIPFLVAAFIMCVPQMAYWQYAFGTPLKWSYGQEGFDHFLAPRLIPFWFAPENGLFLYSPLVLVILVMGLFYRKSMRVSNAASWLAFILVSYLSASWFTWAFGCGFGSRNFAEYGALFAFPLASLLNASMKSRKVIAAVVLICCIYTLKLTFSCAVCWFGSEWDWEMFLRFVYGPFT
ncbi:MAG: hypothetical protein K8H89_10710 [Flavobacteriales bacterium]|jgi:hypothetical protein|nr:hypothetical protein [Flavobacteriales bacterium]